MKFNRKKILKRTADYSLTLIFPVFMWILFLIICAANGSGRSFVSSGGLDYIFRLSITPAIVGIAIAVPLSGGRWDFATGIIAILGAIIGGNVGLMISENVLVILICCIVASTLLAVIEGLVYVTLRVPNMIVSLGAVMIYESFTSVLFGGQGVKLNRYDGILVITQSPWCYIVLAVTLAVSYFLLCHTKFGADTKSLGSNSLLAINSGVKEKKNIMLTYVFVGVLLGIAGLFYACQSNISPVSNLSSTSLMYSSMGSVLVGLFLANKTNLPWGVWVGSVGMQIMTYGMVCSGIDSSLQTVVTGIVIALIMMYTANQSAVKHRIKKMLGAGRRAAVN